MSVQIEKIMKSIQGLREEIENEKKRDFMHN